MIEIYSTSRKIREYYKNFDSNVLLPKAMSIAEFEKRLLYVDGKVLADDDLRILLMREASNFENFAKLKIDRDFFVFLKNSEFLFRFFEELSAERVSLDDLESFDTYAEYSEHLDILKTLLENYKKILDKRGFYDKITLPEIYKLNKDFIKNSGGFLIHLDGLLSQFEYGLLQQAAQIGEVKIEFEINHYNKKLIEIFESFDLNIGYAYVLNLTTRKIEMQRHLVLKKIDAKVVSYPVRLLQSIFVQESIAEFVKEGIEPHNIVVITPDESFARLLREFDRFNNLNLAMGESYAQTKLYKKLEALNRYLKYGELEDVYRIKRLFGSEEKGKKIKDIYSKKCNGQKITEIIKDIANDECEIFQEELYKLEALLERLGSIEFQKAYTIFLSRLKSRSIDDTRGGKVTVMGVLESRGVSYEGVIVVDFNDEFVPKRSSKDMFLNSFIRALAKLPTKADRENLQRYYYYKLFEKARKVAVSFVNDEQNFVSRFLEELGIREYKVYGSLYNSIFKSYDKPKKFMPKDLESPHFIQTLSASKLKNILTCKQKYYFKYILKIDEAKMPTLTVSEADIGNLLHEALLSAFRDLKEINEKNLYDYLKKYLLKDEDILKEYYFLVWLERLKEFAVSEAKRYQEGFRVVFLEKSLQRRYKGLILEGKVDRIDKKEGELYIIDYKSGKVPKCTPKTIEKCTDFQLEFYYLLAMELGEVKSVGYYNLKDGTLEEEKNLDLKLQKLDEILEELQKGMVSFPASISDSCRWCGYDKICTREKK